MIVPETGLPIVVVGIEDVIFDRTMRFDATKDQDAREWALRMMGIHYDEVDWSYLHRRASELYILDAVNRIQRDVKRRVIQRWLMKPRQLIICPIKRRLPC